MKTSFIRSAPHAAIVRMTREVVDELLALNAQNRSVRRSHVEFLRRQIAQGQFCITNQGIGIDVRGTLIDGQHRLLALRDEGYPDTHLVVVSGLPELARAAVDIGLKRSMVDLMQFAFARPDATASSIAVSRAWGIYVIYNGKTTRTIPTEVAEWYVDLLPQIERAFAIPSASRLPAPVLAAIIHRLHSHPTDDRPLHFLSKLVSGAGLEEDSPVLVLRNWLTRSSAPGSHMAGERFTRTATALLAYVESRRLTKLYSRANAARDLTNSRADDTA